MEVGIAKRSRMLLLLSSVVALTTSACGRSSRDAQSQAPVHGHQHAGVGYSSTPTYPNPGSDYASAGGYPIPESPQHEAGQTVDSDQIYVTEQNYAETETEVPDQLGYETLSNNERVTVVTYVHTYPEAIDTYPRVYWAGRWYYNVHGSFVWWDPYFDSWCYYWGPPVPLIAVWNYHYPWVAFHWGVGYYGPSWYWGGVGYYGYHAYGRPPTHYQPPVANAGGPRPQHSPNQSSGSPKPPSSGGKRPIAANKPAPGTAAGNRPSAASKPTTGTAAGGTAAGNRPSTVNKVKPGPRPTTGKRPVAANRPQPGPRPTAGKKPVRPRPPNAGTSAGKRPNVASGGGTPPSWAPPKARPRPPAANSRPRPSASSQPRPSGPPPGWGKAPSGWTKRPSSTTYKVVTPNRRPQNGRPQPASRPNSGKSPQARPNSGKRPSSSKRPPSRTYKTPSRGRRPAPSTRPNSRPRPQTRPAPRPRPQTRPAPRPRPTPSRSRKRG